MLDQLESRLGGLVLSVAPPDWRRVELRATMVNLMADMRIVAVLPDDSTVPLDLPPGLLMTLDELRQVQWEPNTGTWLALRMMIDPPGAYLVSYNFELTPDWDPVITAEEYAEDLNPYPRKPEHVPSWWSGGEPEYGDREQILNRIASSLRFDLPPGSVGVHLSATPGTRPTATVRTVNDTEHPWTPPPFLDELLRHHRAAGKPWHAATIDYSHSGHLRTDFVSKA
ncbi:hypothetical protein [Labedaea rhizosphaerae]|uniref:Uncharacterized protein n=1 Tax=Labedaea rhizosphaerae TaxID=598644 RepID=A0A4R6RUZ9_LABRH|nr:hypothetical protein [Labedaea rhizosphaerae]TDP89916.1 hypothetical protein EV186_11142 [Labedaea rhizosphaerae]